jgi:signal peptidase II
MFTLVYNEGGAMGTNFGSSTYYLISSIFILLFVFYYIYANRENAAFAYPMAFIAGGAIGNIIDRIRLGRVVDFLDFDFFDIQIGNFIMDRWWTFNIADAAITCSIVYLVIYMLFFYKSHPSETKPSQPVTE